MEPSSRTSSFALSKLGMDPRTWTMVARAHFCPSFLSLTISSKISTIRLSEAELFCFFVPDYTLAVVAIRLGRHMTRNRRDLTGTSRRDVLRLPENRLDKVEHMIGCRVRLIEVLQVIHMDFFGDAGEWL